jgi:hypothetical protein
MPVLACDDRDLLVGVGGGGERNPSAMLRNARVTAFAVGTVGLAVGAPAPAPTPGAGAVAFTA